jgi:hypothetical protein
MVIYVKRFLIQPSIIIQNQVLKIFREYFNLTYEFAHFDHCQEKFELVLMSYSLELVLTNHLALMNRQIGELQ